MSPHHVLPLNVSLAFELVLSSAPTASLLNNPIFNVEFTPICLRELG